jgi:hypothetical protein
VEDAPVKKVGGKKVTLDNEVKTEAKSEKRGRPRKVKEAPALDLQESSADIS